MTTDRLPDAVIDISQMHFEGNITPHEWYKHLRYDSGKPHLNAIIVLADIVYWYRWAEIRDESTGRVVGHRKKFAGHKLQRNYSAYEELFGLTKKQARDAVDYLVDAGLVTKEVVRKLDLPNGKTLFNVMYLEPVSWRINAITYGEMEPAPDDTPMPYRAEGSALQGMGVCPVGQTNTETTSTETTSTENPPTGGAEAPERHETAAEMFRRLHGELAETKNRTAKLMEIYALCYGDSNLPDFAKLGAFAKKVGGAGRLADLLWQNTTRPPTGDVLDYIYACEKGKKKGQSNGSGRKKANTGATNGSGYTQPASQTPTDEAAWIRANLGHGSPLASD